MTLWHHVAYKEAVILFERKITKSSRNSSHKNPDTCVRRQVTIEPVSAHAHYIHYHLSEENHIMYVIILCKTRHLVCCNIHTRTYIHTYIHTRCLRSYHCEVNNSSHHHRHHYHHHLHHPHYHYQYDGLHNIIVRRPMMISWLACRSVSHSVVWPPWPPCIFLR